MIELADIPGGYGWVFPKGDHVNVGVGAWGEEGPRLRTHLSAVCAAHGHRARAISGSCAVTVCRFAGRGRASQPSGRCSWATRRG